MISCIAHQNGKFFAVLNYVVNVGSEIATDACKCQQDLLMSDTLGAMVFLSVLVPRCYSYI